MPTLANHFSVNLTVKKKEEEEKKLKQRKMKRPETHEVLSQ